MIRKLIKKCFNLYDISDLRIGGNCGLCGKWINNAILPEDWAIGICKECLK